MTAVPTDALKWIDRRLLYPPLMGAYERVLNACAADGAVFYASSGFRSFTEQNVLYEQGRTTKGPHAGEPNYPTLGLTVTKARGGESAHNYGLAIDSTRDLYVDRAGLQPDWDLSHYEVLARHAKAQGLDAAFYWPTFREGPHVQVNLEAIGLSLKLVRMLANRYRTDEDRRKAVWQLVDDRGGVRAGS